MKPHTIYFLLLALLAGASAKAPTEEELKKYLAGEYEMQASQMCTKSVLASWDYETDITSEHADTVTQVTLESAQFDKEVYNKWFKDVKADDIKDPSIKRMLKDLQLQGSAALDDAKLKQLTEAISKMTMIYSSAKICPFDKQESCNDDEKLNLEPEIEEILAANPDGTKYDELAYVWSAWRDASGKKMRELFKTYVTLSNEVGTANHFHDYGAYWRESFETVDFEKQLDGIWDQLKPLYAALHKYTSGKLKALYGNDLDISDGLLPAHLLGNMWAQSWSNLDKLLRPFANASEVDVNAKLREKYTNVKQLFEESDHFYTSLGLPSNAVSFGGKSMIERPAGREVTCHASAWDFCDKADYRIKMCTQIDQEDFVTVHHEMGHIQYYLLYKDQPLAFREGANPGFHEAVGDTMALSVQSIPHLKKLALLPSDYRNSQEASINTLMSMALEKIAFLPFGFLIDKWRWHVFAGNVTEQEWNKHWWDLRKEYQLIRPPMPRDESNFDPGAKFHVAADSQYISYFVSHILQFQFYRGLCIAAGEYDPVTKSPPLHECDFFENKKAGELIKQALSLGKSRPWPEVLQIIAGTDKLDACALLEYFNPLRKYFGLEGDAACDKTDTTGAGTRVALPLSSLLVLVVGVLAQRFL